jgi:hypothetical protein
MPKDGPATQNISRRNALRLAAVGILSSTAAAVATQQWTSGTSEAADGASPPAGEMRLAASGGESFNEVYRGRRISGATGRPVETKQAPADTPFAIGLNAPQVLIDGAALHIMTNADGTYTSVVNHYESFRSLRAVARAAVDDLGKAALVPMHHHG